MVRGKAKLFGRGLASNKVARSFLISLLVHFMVIGGSELGRSLGLWERSLFQELGSSALDEIARAEQAAQEQLLQAMARIPEAQLVFVEVDQSQAAAEPPPDSKHYSSLSSVAANPETGEQETPKLDGSQEQVIKTLDSLRPVEPEPAPAPPEETTPPEAEPEPEPQPPRMREEEKPAPPREPGDTLLARAAPPPQPEPPPEERRRPRTLAEARARRGIIEAPRSRQAGGVRKFRIDAGLDVRATPFGAYDLAFIEAVQARWFNLLDERDFVGGQSGKVVLAFRLNYDGRILEMRVVQSEVSEMLSWFCQRAVLDPAPYRPFPSDMRRLTRNDFREIRFTFYYNQ